MTKHHE